MKSEVFSETLKATPPTVVAWLTLNEWVALATAIYIALQAAYLLRKWWREEHDRQAGP